MIDCQKTYDARNARNSSLLKLPNAEWTGPERCIHEHIEFSSCNKQILSNYLATFLYKLPRTCTLHYIKYVLGWVGLRGTMAHHCITACSEECSLASNLQAQQQGFAFQQSDSSEYSLPRLQILNRNGPYNMVWMQLLLPDLRKASRPTIFNWFVL